MTDPLGLRWTAAPQQTQWGGGMLEALLPLGNDHTLRLYVDADAVHLVGPALRTLAVGVFAERDALREVAARMVAGIDHLDKLTREWEPDHSSGGDRRGWLLAKDARDDAARLLGPNAKLCGPGREEAR